MNTALSALFWGYIAVSCAVLWVGAVAVWLVTLPFDRRLRALHLYSCWWAYHYIRISPLWSVTFTGVERVPDHPAVLVSNHQSLADILVLFGLYRHFKWVSKSEIFRVPFIGWNMVMNRYVRLVRGGEGAADRLVADCLGHLHRGSSVMIFPEGTRSRDGELRPFKHGAFTVAVQAGVPVVPIVLDGTGDVLPKKGWVLQGGRVHGEVRVLEPVHPDEVGGDPDLLRELVRERMAAALVALRAA